MSTVRPADRELAAVARLSEALFELTSADALIARTLETALSEVDAESGSVLIADSSGAQLIFRCSIGEQPVPPGTAIPWDRGIAGAVFQSGRAQRISDVQHDPQHLTTIDQRLGHITRDLLSVPLRRWGGEPIGVMNVLNKRHGAFDEGDLSLMTVLAAIAAVAIQQAERFEEAKLAEVARTLGSLSHDLKNLLTPVISSAGLLSEELAQLFARPALQQDLTLIASRELSLEAIELIRRTSERIHQRVREIADCVKGRSTPAVFAPCDLGAVAKDVLATLAPLAREASVSLDVDGFAPLGPLLADQHRLYSALYNLVLNAIPETPPGGRVTLSARCATDSAVELEVRDSGRGIAPEVLERLFSARAVSTKTGGTGLGTRIVKDAIEAHGGTVTVESVLGAGTAFRIVLPRRPPGLEV